MNTKDIIATAIGNTRRSKARTTLTILAIFVGAFTLTLTSGVGTGINRYIDETVAAIGSSDTMTVTKTSDTETAIGDDGPREYDPDAVSTGMPGASTVAMTDSDISQIGRIDGIEEVEPVKSISIDYVQVDDGTAYVGSIGSVIPGQTLQLAEGVEPDDDSAEYQITIPADLVDAFGFDEDADAIGETVTVSLTDASYETHSFEAEIVGITEAGLVGTGSSFTPNDALEAAMYDAQSIGLPSDQQDRWSSAIATFDADLSDDEITELQDELADAGFTGTTTADQLGAFTTVIDTIVLVLNAFAIIALIAAGFGIVNTLLMSVQERTREIGLMKAMGMASRRIFTLFSIEAVWIGFLGSLVGVVGAMLVGSSISAVLANGLLADLPGLTLIAFDPVSVLTTILVIMLVAFLAGTLPAVRAARKDPVEALRYE